MKRKIFTLLTLALLSIGTAWASTVSDLTSITSATTFTMDGLNSKSALENGTLYSDSKLLCLGGCGYSDQKGSTTYNAVSYNNVYQIKSNRQIALKIGFNATITIVGNSDSGRKWRLGTASGGNQIAESAVSTTTLSANVDGSSSAKVVYINASSDLYIGAIIITANSSPAINAASSASIKATESGVEATEDIAITGSNLTGGTLTATLSPSVAGLSVTLGSSTITAGAISTTATLHYTKTENAEGSTTLTLSDGTTSKDITINYRALVVPTELVAISGPTTFDLKNTGEGLNDVTPDDYVVLTDAGSEASFSDNLAVKGVGTLNVTWRSDAIQAGFFKFKTTVPGTVTLKFSDTGGTAGGSRAPRYANVNGTRSNVSSNGSSGDGAQVTCAPIAVNAGEVIIKGEQYNSGEDNYTDNQIRVFTITFTPTEQQVSTLSGRNYASYVPSQKLDFASAAGITAYIATGLNGGGTAVEITPVDIVPAGTPIIVKTDTKGATVNVPVTTSDADDVSGNALVAGDGTTAWDGTDGYKYYYLASDQFHEANAGTLQSGKAYLKVASGTGAPQLSIDFGEGETTGINAVKGAEFKVNGEYYNLAGQRVAQPTKGLYIVNGRKVVIK